MGGHQSPPIARTQAHTPQGIFQTRGRVLLRLRFPAAEDFCNLDLEGLGILINVRCAPTGAIERKMKRD